MCEREKRQNRIVSKDNKILQTKYDELLSENSELQQSKKKIDTVANNKGKEHNSVLAENIELRDYIQRSGHLVDVQNTVKEVTEVGKRQQDRKLKRRRLKEVYGLQKPLT